MCLCIRTFCVPGSSIIIPHQHSGEPGPLASHLLRAALGQSRDFRMVKIAYAGSGALHARAVIDGLSSSLSELDSDQGCETSWAKCSRSRVSQVFALNSKSRIPLAYRNQ